MAKRPALQPAKLSADDVRRVEADVLSALLPVVPEAFFLVGVSLEKEAGIWYLRVFLDKPDRGISLEDCEQISRLIDPVLETLPLPEFSYTLEVSSPGLFRPLKTARECAFYQHQPVRIQQLAPAAGKNKSKQPAFTDGPAGVLAAWDEAAQTVSVKLADGATRTVSLDDANERVVLDAVLQLD